MIGERDSRGFYKIEQKNKFCVGEEIEAMKKDGRNLLVTVKGIFDEEGISMDSAPHPKQILYLDLGEDLEEFDILRRKE